MSQIKSHLFPHLVVMSIAMLAICSCKNASEESVANTEPLFTLLAPEKTGIQFTNTLTEGPNTNILMYEYFYNGGGVAIGDVNEDGLEDIYFTGNMTDNKLYLNKGGMQFTDITNQAGVSGRPGPWKTGVTMADVNGDGLLDIYVCYSGNLRPEKLVSQLFINQGTDSQGIPQFQEQAEQFGLAYPANSTQAYFFDYDKDGDLDLFLLNHNPRAMPILDEASTAEILNQPDSLYGVRLFQNNKNRFVDVTGKAGLSSSALTYGLAAGIADINSDGWPDIYLSNDYSVPDYLYLNNGDGSFTDKIQSSLGYTSQFSMGNDISDINNDGLADIFTLDMLPPDNYRQKLLFAPDNYEKFDLNVKSGFYYQYMRNMLQVNNGDGTFSEIGQLSGISNTDWSWAPLFADYDNDGWKDLFVTNGYVRDFTNMDFMKYMGDKLENREAKILRADILKLVEQMPASNVINYLFKNNGDLTFSDVGLRWGMDIPSNSNGAAYADLDNDGDLDLVVNNINKPAFIYQNEANRQLKHHYLKIKLQGEHGNTAGLGAKVWIFSNGKQQFLEQMPSRGYQSSVSPVLHFGLGREAVIDSLCIVWLSGKQQVINAVKTNQLITLEEKNATSTYKASKTLTPLFTEAPAPFKYTHTSTTLNDFKRQPLMIRPMSFSGPCMVKGDVNGDQLEDIYTGGGSGNPGMLYLQQKSGQFVARPQLAFDADKQCEDGDAFFFDANGDGFTDLYVASGGYHNFQPEDPMLQDRLYLNDGKGNFTKAIDALPSMPVSKSCVRPTDINGDGFTDLFVGGRVVPGRYPETPKSYLLLNDGKGRFKEATASIAPELQDIGMVSDAAWIDLNGDKKQDLIVVGEWMPVTVFINNNGKLQNNTNNYFQKEYRGWWNKLLVEDVNGDGKEDLIIGNEGLNAQCKASDKEPVELYFKDFDDNGAVDPVLCFYIQGKSYPYVFRDELLDQMSIMRTRYQDYKSYADATLTDIFTPEELKGAAHLKANCLTTTLFIRNSKGIFEERSLPLAAQYAPVFTITPLDYNNDGKKDLLLCGNINQARLRFGKINANYGVLLQGDGKGGFHYVQQRESGLQLGGDVRSVIPVNNSLLFGINGQAMKAYKTTNL